jgi:hypothetical protein
MAVMEVEDKGINPNEKWLKKWKLKSNSWGPRPLPGSGTFSNFYFNL